MPRVNTAVSEAVTIIQILRLIPRNSRITAREIRLSLSESGIEMPDRRLQRILQNICDCPELGIECDKRNRPYGYIRRLPESSLSVTRLRPQESLLLRLCEERLGRQLPASVTASLEPLFTAAKESLRETDTLGRQAAWLRKVVSVPSSLPFLPAAVKSSVYDAVSEALYRDAKLQLSYQNQNAGDVDGTVSPLGLVQQEGRLYLVCRFDGYDDVRHLALHRMKSAEVLEEPADRPGRFDLRKYVEEHHFNYSYGRRIRLVLEFESPVMALNLKETPLSRPQSLMRLDDGCWRLEAETDDSFLLDGWIAAWREDAGIRSVEKVPLNDEKET